ncbi:MAG: hypothetical protein QF412_06120, partial [Planctomycetota bacterium]|nr:hypothetical protein [Planctomycetota bacterium]
LPRCPKPAILSLRSTMNDVHHLTNEFVKPGQSLHLLNLEELAAWPEDLQLTSPHFRLFLACDARHIAAEQTQRFADKILDQGAAYVSLWGPDSYRIDTVIEEADSLRNLNAAPGRPVVATSWHRTEPLKEAIWFFLNCTEADPAFQNTCNTWLAASIGNVQWFDDIWHQLEMQGAMRAPRKQAAPRRQEIPRGTVPSSDQRPQA